MRPAGIITLLTDFGVTDAYVGEMKGVLLSLAPAATLVDLTHDVSPGDVRAAAHVLARAWPRYPAGTVHLVVVDPGVGSARAGLLVRAGGQAFVGPDNGVLTSALAADPRPVLRLNEPPDASPTFHGRDVFAPAAACIARGDDAASVGLPFIGAPIRLPAPEPWYEGKVLIGEVVYIDRFGNVVTNLDTTLVPDYGSVEMEGVEIGRLRRSFSDVPPGELLAYVGSGGQVEIAVRDGSAARRLGLGVGSRVRVRLG